MNSDLPQAKRKEGRMEFLIYMAVHLVATAVRKIIFDDDD
jgi:hypothetical protein